MVLANVTDEQMKTRRREIIVDGEVFRKLKHHPNYYISDCGTVMSTVGKWKILQGFPKGKRFGVTKYEGTRKTFGIDRLCVMAFGGR